MTIDVIASAPHLDPDLIPLLEDLQAQITALPAAQVGPQGPIGPQGVPGATPDLTSINSAIYDLQTQLAPIVAWFNAPETPPAPTTEADIETGFGDLDTILKTAPPTLVAAIQKVLTDLAGLGLTLPSTTPPVVTPPAPVWTTVAQQHQGFTLNAQSTVRYGEIARDSDQILHAELQEVRLQQTPSG